MNYQQTLDYLFLQLPMFQRIGAAAYKANLDNTIAICNLLDNPQNKIKTIHIAGTNGKGSVSHMLASVLQEAGYKTGLYTSPHLKDFRERIKINGEMISEKYVVDFVEKNRTEFEKIAPSFFEMTVGLAFDYFVNQKIDIAVIETGLGGRLDSTNVIIPELSVITNISFDHIQFLGDTLEKIAIEKAGIIKKNIPVVIGETQNETKQIFMNAANKNNSPIYFADTIYKAIDVTTDYNQKSFLQMNIEKNGVEVYKNLKTELLGLYQQKNISTVLGSIDVLREKGFRISENALTTGIEKVISNTNLLGRWQVISNGPLIIADTAHNEAGIKEIIHQLTSIQYQKLHFVLGVVSDKDVSKILSLLPKAADYYFCKSSIPRALDENELAIKAKEYGLKGTIHKNVPIALQEAKNRAEKEDLIFIGGSTFTVADVV